MELTWPFIKTNIFQLILTLFLQEIKLQSQFWNAKKHMLHNFFDFIKFCNIKNNNKKKLITSFIRLMIVMEQQREKNTLWTSIGNRDGIHVVL